MGVSQGEVEKPLEGEENGVSGEQAGWLFRAPLWFAGLGVKRAPVKISAKVCDAAFAVKPILY
ncbi:MAG: hypothetical protein LBT71_02625 [Azoarcus sp.]|jgi:hypothetical protein|nr:hypothetical protein [Azoarcus sp.]